MNLIKEKQKKYEKLVNILNEQKESFRTRMFAGCAAKAALEGKVESGVIEVTPKLDPKPKLTIEPIKLSDKVLVDLTLKIPMPRTGRKLDSKPASE